MKMYLKSLLTIGIFLLSSCTSFEKKQSLQVETEQQEKICSQLASISSEANDLIGNQELEKLNIVRGQKYYLPFYSQIITSGEMGMIDLTGILAIHNTSETDPIIITSIRYYDSSGKLVEDCLVDTNIRLASMANIEINVVTSGSQGSGSNFIVEWVAEKDVSDPFVESIMIAISGTQGFSFASQGKIIEELK